jgi:hypothetical protein
MVPKVLYIYQNFFMKAIKFLLANAVLGVQEYSNFNNESFVFVYKNSNRSWDPNVFKVLLLNGSNIILLVEASKGIYEGQSLFSFLYKNPLVCLKVLWKVFKYYKVFINAAKYRNIKSVDITALS